MVLKWKSTYRCRYTLLCLSSIVLLYNFVEIHIKGSPKMYFQDTTNKVLRLYTEDSSPVTKYLEVESLESLDNNVFGKSQQNFSNNSSPEKTRSPGVQVTNVAKETDVDEKSASLNRQNVTMLVKCIGTTTTCSPYTLEKHLHVSHKKEYRIGRNSQCLFPVNCSTNCNPAFSIDFSEVTLRRITVEQPDVTVGGHWQPEDCLSKPLAIIIAYRDREQHRNILLRNIIKFLKIQKTAFSIYIIEQAGNTLFNRASLLNIGFLEAMQRQNHSCFIFHDVDMLPVRLCNIYACPESGARHLAVSINSNPTKIYYKGFVGGAMAISTWAMKRINGFTNIMFGWGGEDDNVRARLKNANIRIERFDSYVGNYTMIKHKRDKTNPQADRGLDRCYQTSLHYKLDGLHNVDYKLISYDEHKLFTKITVELKGPKTLEEAWSYFDEKYVAYNKQMNITDVLMSESFVNVTQPVENTTKNGSQHDSVRTSKQA